MAVIAIDGQAGSGKSTLARAMASALDLPYVNTGLMYRALADAALAKETSPDDAAELEAIARSLVFAIDAAGDPRSLLVNGAAPGAELSTENVERVVSAVSRHPQVRSVMVAEQRRLAEGGAVVEGRDIASVVFPGAETKIFLAARKDVRATRRIEERGGKEHVAAELSARDSKDAQTNPPVPAPGAIEIDTSEKTADQVLTQALAIVRKQSGN